MIEVEDNIYEKLKKDANDNRAVLRIARTICIFLFIVILLFVYGTRLIDISLEKYRASVKQEIAIEEAHNNVRIREIESSGMTTEEYLKWLEIRNAKNN